MKAFMTDDCIVCGSCADVCPQKCFVAHASYGGYRLDNTNCIGCGQCVDNCAAGALEMRE
jgi:formate hydrogenlyase subunit 6/NADH:ubiquinone oxidoreductase subunit I